MPAVGSHLAPLAVEDDDVAAQSWLDGAHEPGAIGDRGRGLVGNEGLATGPDADDAHPLAGRQKARDQPLSLRFGLPPQRGQVDVLDLCLAGVLFPYRRYTSTTCFSISVSVSGGRLSRFQSLTAVRACLR